MRRSNHSFSRIIAGLWFVAGYASAQVVINEILYDAEPDTALHEFVELHNAGGTPVDLSGWSITSGIGYTFTNGVVLAPGGYIAVAENPVALQAAYGGPIPYGPYTGGLTVDGEKVVLRDAQGTKVDEVDYKRGFPWPTCPDGQSMELVHPSLDNDLGGSWRSSGNPLQTAQTFLPAHSTDWHYRRGTNAPSIPDSAWREQAFIEDDTWSVGQASIGYGDDDDNTELPNMRYNYWSVYFRHGVYFAPGLLPTQLLMRVYVDDGCIVWINDQELSRFHVADGDKSYNDSAINHDAAWEDFVVTNAAAFFSEGVTNIVAVHALQSSLSSSDFSMDLELLQAAGAGTGPSPQALNRTASDVLPPHVRQVRHEPEMPKAGEPVRVSAKVTDPQGIQSVSLAYVPIEPGSYVQLTGAAYETGWTNVVMVDDGTGGDLAAGDNVWTATLPGTLQIHRRLVRYRITAVDLHGNTVTCPYADDPQPNFAYFCYNEVPGWTGADQPGSTPAERFPSSVMTNTLPVYHFIADSVDVERCQYSSSYRNTRFYGTMVYDGEVYDHVQYKVRGEASTYQSGKNKWRFYFQLGHHFEARDMYGKKYPNPFRRMNFNACASPWVPANRGMAGLDEAVSTKLYDLAGVLTPRMHPVHFRIIDDANEAPTDQYSGDLWGLYLSVEHIDGKFLDNHDLPDGNTYKIQGGNGDKRNQGETQSTDTSDWDSFKSSAQNGSTAESWWRSNFHLESYYSFRTINRAASNVDLRDSTNYGMYHHTNGTWYTIPQDLDMMFLPETHWSGKTYMQNALNRTALALEFKNRARELQDLLFSDASPTGGQGVQAIYEYAAHVSPPGATQTFAVVDQYMWNHHSRTRGGHVGNFYVTPKNDTRKGGTWTRTLATADLEGFQKYIADFITDTDPDSWSVGDGDQRGYGFNYVESEAFDVDIPHTPVVTYVGPAEFPVDRLDFTSSAFDDPNGSGSFSNMAWRIGEVRNPGSPVYQAGDRWKYEVESVWESGAIQPFAEAVTIPPAGLVVDGTYRVRVRHQDDTGRWSHWSAPVEFVAGPPEGITALQDLVLTEILYNPVDSNEMSFIEFHNRGAGNLYLEGVSLDDAVEFTFGPGDVLAPGGFLVVVENVVEFSNRYQSAASPHYHPGLAVAGQWSGGLNGGGEEIAVTAPGGQDLLRFDYKDSSPWPERADGQGSSAELVAPSQVPLVDPSRSAWYDNGDNWRSSSRLHGSPGRLDAAEAPLRISELLAHSDAAPGLDWIELENTGTVFVAFADLYLADSLTNLAGVSLATITNGLGPGQRVVLHEDQFSFAFSELGDEAVVTLMSNSIPVEFVDVVDFGASDRDVPFGLHTRSDSQTDFTAQRSATPGSENAYPLVGPAVISEIMIAPSNGIEFIEIANLSGQPLPLCDPLYPSNTWKLTSAVNFTFPLGTVIPGDGVIMVSATNAAAFRAAYGVSPDVPAYGPWAGALNNAGESVKLRKPAPPELDGSVPMVLADRVDYRPNGLWPVAGVGTGHSIERVAAYAYGNDPVNWTASDAPGGTPGVAAASREHLVMGAPPEGTPPGTVAWSGIPGESYTVRFCDDLRVADWQPLQSIVASTPDVHVTDPAATNAAVTKRFYSIWWVD